MPASDRARRQYNRFRESRCKNVRFEKLCRLLEMYDWQLDRIAQNNHYLYVHTDYEGLVSILKPYRGPHVLRPYCLDALDAIAEVEGYD